jgi:putative ABC transport system permease protein
MRQLLIESVLQSLFGAVAGLGLASADLEWRRASIPAFILRHIPGLAHLRIDACVLAFTAALAVAAGVIAGLAFAWHATRTDLNETLKESSRGAGAGSSSHRLRGVIVVTEFALALVLLAGAGAMVTGFRRLANANLGFDRRNVLTFRIALPEPKYREPAQVRHFYVQLVERLGAQPGVESAAASLTLPAQWDWNRTLYTGEGQPPAGAGELRMAGLEAVTPDIFRVLRIPVIHGRVFTSQDGPDSVRVVVLNATLAKRLWPGENPVGKRVRFGDSAVWCNVVGVVGDVAIDPIEHWTPPIAYFPVSQVTYNSLSLAVRTLGDPDGIVAAARAQVQALDPEQPVFDVRSLERVVDDDLSGVKLSADMMTIYGLIALVLSASGIFALMAYSVSQRRHEIGVRMALGAQHRDVVQWVMGRALTLALVGLAIGVPAAIAMTHALSSVLYGVVQVNTRVFAGFTVLLVLVAALAAYIPSRWATKVDPVVALKYE